MFKTFLESQLCYCQVLCSRKLKNKINRQHERALTIAYVDYVSSVKKLLIKNGSVTNQQRNLKLLGTTMYKISRDISSRFMQYLAEELVPSITLGHVMV